MTDARARTRWLRRAPWVTTALAVGLSAAAPAAAWEIRRDPPRADFEAFHRRAAAAAYPYPRHGAKPLGITGFRVFADVGGDPDFESEPFAATVIDGNLPLDALAFARVGARKGLPGGIDLGASYGRAVGGDLELVSAEVAWAILDGGAVAPAVAVRVTGTRTVGGDVYDLDIYGAELEVSKGFAVVTPYAGAGVYRSEGELDRGAAAPSRFTTDDDRGFVYAGLTLNLLVPKLTFELTQGETLVGAFGVALGF